MAHNVILTVFNGTSKLVTVLGGFPADRKSLSLKAAAGRGNG